MIFLGDTHNIYPIFELIDIYNIRDSNIISVGDINIGFQHDIIERANLAAFNEMAQETNNRFYLIRGNHDKKFYWDHPVGLTNIYFMQDNTTEIIEGKKVLFCGGATSIDRKKRAPNTYDENERVEVDLSIKYTNIDIMVSHCAPICGFPHFPFPAIVEHYAKNDPELKADILEDATKLQELYESLSPKPKLYFFGHFHRSNTITVNETTFKCLAINELYELKTNEK